MSEIEVTTKFATTVRDLGEAWAFVMGHVDSVGPDPQVHINPFWTIEEDGWNSGRRFEVSVGGMVKREDDS